MLLQSASITGTIALIALAAATTEPAASQPPSPQPAFDKLWDYQHPDRTERAFRALLPEAEKSGDPSYLLQLQTQIARCQGLQGKFDECHATLDAVEKRLNDAAPVARVRYLLERGRAFNSSGKPELARPLFQAAWDRARDANETGYAIDAAHMMAIADPNLDAQVEWARKGLAMVEAAPDQKRWLPALYNNLGETYRARKEYDKALDCFEKLAQFDRDRGRTPDIFTMKDIARMNRLLGHPDVALKLIEPIAKDLVAKKSPNGYISAEYGQCLAATGHLAEAKPFLVEAYEILSTDNYMLKSEPDELRVLKELADLAK